MNSYFAFLQRRKIRVEIPSVNEFKQSFKYNSVFSKEKDLKKNVCIFLILSKYILLLLIAGDCLVIMH